MATPQQKIDRPLDPAPVSEPGIYCFYPLFNSLQCPTAVYDLSPQPAKLLTKV